MPDNLGPGPYLTFQLSIDQYTSAISDLEAELIDNSMDLRLKQKHSAAQIEDIHNKYNPEQALIRNEMRNTNKLDQEYYDLMSELQESQDEEDRLVESVEAESTDYQSFIDIQNTNIETRLEAMKSDKEGMEEAQKDDMEG